MRSKELVLKDSTGNNYYRTSRQTTWWVSKTLECWGPFASITEHHGICTLISRITAQRWIDLLQLPAKLLKWKIFVNTLSCSHEMSGPAS